MGKQPSTEVEGFIVGRDDAHPRHQACLRPPLARRQSCQSTDISASVENGYRYCTPTALR